MIEFREIPHGGEAYGELLALREEVLRRPLGLAFTPGEREAEKADIHLAGFDGEGEVVAGALLHPAPDSPGLVQVRQVVIAERLRGRGEGAWLMAAVEELARAKGFREIKLNAREPIVEFYSRLGYEARGEKFLEVTIPHQEMRKLL